MYSIRDQKNGVAILKFDDCLMEVVFNYSGSFDDFIFRSKNMFYFLSEFKTTIHLLDDTEKNFYGDRANTLRVFERHCLTNTLDLNTTKYEYFGCASKLYVDEVKVFARIKEEAIQLFERLTMIVNNMITISNGLKSCESGSIITIDSLTFNGSNRFLSNISAGFSYEFAHLLTTLPCNLTMVEHLFDGSQHLNSCFYKELLCQFPHTLKIQLCPSLYFQMEESYTQDLADGLKASKAEFISLNLSRNKIGEEFIKAFVTARSERTQPMTLYLSHNPIGKEGEKVLLDALKPGTFPMGTKITGVSEKVEKACSNNDVYRTQKMKEDIPPGILPADVIEHHVATYLSFFGDEITKQCEYGTEPENLSPTC